MKQHTSKAIAPTFTDAELREIDAKRGSLTRTGYVKSAFIKTLKTPKKQEPLKHTCGTKLQIIQCKEDGVVFLICHKCNESKKLTNLDYQNILAIGADKYDFYGEGNREQSENR